MNHRCVRGYGRIALYCNAGIWIASFHVVQNVRSHGYFCNKAASSQPSPTEKIDVNALLARGVLSCNRPFQFRPLALDVYGTCATSFVQHLARKRYDRSIMAAVSCNWIALQAIGVVQQTS
jgi:hypothetical protein